MNKQTINHLLRISAILLFFGRSWEHFRWLGPYRDVFYNPNGVIITFVSAFTNETVTEIYNNHFYENLVINFSRGLGGLFLLSGLVILFYEKLKKLKGVIYLSLLGLAFNYFGLFMGKHFEMWGMFFEHSAQLVIPLLFLFTLNEISDKTIYLAQLAISITFISHGLFAVGYYPQPGSFADMLIVSFGMEENIARLTLVIVGVLDFVFGLVLLIPYEKLDTRLKTLFFYSWVWYGIVWGFLTAAARFYAPFSFDLFWSNLTQDLFQFFVRVPHFTIPLFIYYGVKLKRSQQKEIQFKNK
jgi:hypothetical protein